MSTIFSDIKVLHILGPLRPSGMERMLVSAARHFSDASITNVILGQGGNHPFADELRKAGHEVRILPFVGSSWSGARQLRELVRELRIDVIHIHTEGNYLRTAIAAKLAVGRRGQLVRTIHSIFDARGKWRVTRLVQALLADRVVFALIAPSPEVAANERKNCRRTRVVYNWVDDRFIDIREGRRDRARSTNDVPVALIVGNCSEIKHHELALRALVSSRHQLMHLGDERGASTEELELLQKLELDGRLLVRGTHDPDAALACADYFVMPSRHEGMGVALAEALVAGVPAFVNDAPGLRWAAPLNGVRALPADDHAWAIGLEAWREAEVLSEPVAIDFSAARGAREYAEIYRCAMSVGTGVSDFDDTRSVQ